MPIVTPPPVPQSGTQEHYRRSAVRPRCSAPYAWDLPPCQPSSRPTVTLVAPGGQADTFDMNHLNQRKPLHYDNFMFIAFSGTFGGCVLRAAEDRTRRGGRD